jgi:hypothetical protein
MDFIRRGGFHCGFAAPFPFSLAKQKLLQVTPQE